MGECEYFSKFESFYKCSAMCIVGDKQKLEDEWKPLEPLLPHRYQPLTEKQSPCLGED